MGNPKGNKATKLRWIIALALASVPSAKADFSVPNLDLTDFNRLVTEFSANSQYTTLTPASSLGGLWGFELGVVGGFTKAPDTLALVKRNDPNTSFKENFPHGNILARVGLPVGLTVEGLWLPKIKAQNISFNSWGAAAQWTLTDVVLEDFPLNLALKGSYARSNLTYSQNISGVPATIDFKTKLWGFTALASYKFLILEPYIGYGYISANGTLNVDASVPVTLLQFLPTAANQTTTSKPTSSQFMAGMDLRFVFFSLGAEYARAFGTGSYNARVSLRF